MPTAILLSVALMRPAEPPPLPPHWYGVWAGTLIVTPEKGDPKELPMALEIAPLVGTPRYTFRLTYGPPGTRPRDYELVPKKDRPGRFEIDERNGIRLDARLTGDTLHATFQVSDALIQSRYERVGDVLKVEMTACAMKDPTVTKSTAGGAEVKAFAVVSVQTAEL
ncbi:MAG: hypothetical protein K2P78_04205, partial [Gemmataceae bacterium]|nr:hypothetical protein [Gemmataceae bacterium]